MKRGGVGYMQPDADTFPRFVDVNAMLLASGAIPLYGLVDGLSPGERRLEEMLAFLMAQGIAGLNLVPDRNWNLPDPDERAIKVRRLHEIMALARDLDLPVLAGTEMNKAGQRLIDDFGAEPLRPYLADFLRGADWLHGHTVLQRAHGAGYNSAWAQAHLPDQRQRNAFYVRVGRAVAAGPEALLARLGA
jgi:sugar phosphate isomerase/epimerase